MGWRLFREEACATLHYTTLGRCSFLLVLATASRLDPITVHSFSVSPLDTIPAMLRPRLTIIATTSFSLLHPCVLLSISSCYPFHSSRSSC